MKISFDHENQISMMHPVQKWPKLRCLYIVSYIYLVILPQMVINCSFGGNNRQTFTGTCWGTVEQLSLLTHRLKPTIHDPIIGHYNGIPGFIYLNDTIVGPRKSRGS